MAPSLGGTARRVAQRQLAASGDVTSINGVSLYADWVTADPRRAQMYLDASEWKAPAFDVTMPGAALDTPDSMRVGDQVTWIVPGQTSPWRGVIRKLDPITVNQRTVAVLALVVLTGNS